MKNLIRLTFMFLAATITNPAFSQPGFPSVSTNNSVRLPCGQNCTNLSATAFLGAQTTSYTVEQIPYAPPFAYNLGTPILVSIDDRWSNPVSLPFNFCFFGVPYNSIIVGSNGVISFTVTNSGTTNNWQIPGPLPSATPTDIRNSIMCPWQDMDPSFRGNIYYRVVGTAPARTLVVSWYRIPLYGDMNSFSPAYCPTQALFCTQQVVLYETTNAIETYIENKPICAAWNNGYAVHGIQNAAGTVAYTVPGRNATAWTATNDAWRFTPAGPPNFSISWFDKSGVSVGTGSSIQVCADTITTYTVRAEYTNCDNSKVTVSDTVRLIVKSPFDTLKVTPVYNPVVCYEALTGTATAAVTGGPGPYTYSWSNQNDSVTATDLPVGNFSVTLTDGFQCTASASGSFSRSTQIWYTSILDLRLCEDPPYGNLSIVDTGGLGGPGSRTYILSGVDTNTTGQFQNVSPGSYLFIIRDSVGCTGTGTIVIPPGAQNDSFAIVTDSTSCFGTDFNDGMITITPANTTAVYQYSIDGGATFQFSNTFENVAGGNYNIVIKNLVFGCLYYYTAEVGQPVPISANASPDTIVTPPNIGNTIIVNHENFRNPVYSWSPIAGLNCSTCDTVTASVVAYTVYYVTVSETENSNCFVFDSIIVVVTNGYEMPDAFTPNGDGKNDLFGPVTSGIYTIKAFRIYNRWGQMVHNSLANWDGKFNGKLQPVGTYSYYIEVEIPDGDRPGMMKTDSRQGSVVLLQ